MRKKAIIGFVVLLTLSTAGQSHAGRIEKIGSSSEMVLKTPLRVIAGKYFTVQLDARYRLDMRCTDTSYNSDSYGKTFFLKAGKANRRMAFTKTGQQTLHFECSPSGSSNDVWYAGRHIYVSN